MGKWKWKWYKMGMVMDKGFTLIEAMITIAIVSISISIAVPYYREYVWQAKAMEAFSIIDELNSKVKKCYLDDINVSNCNIGSGFLFSSASTTHDIYENNFIFNNFTATISLSLPNNIPGSGYYDKSYVSYNIKVSSKENFVGTQNSVLKYQLIYVLGASPWGYSAGDNKRTLSAPEGWNWNSNDNCLVYNKRGDCYDL